MIDLENEGRVWGETAVFFLKILWPRQKAKENSVETIQTVMPRVYSLEKIEIVSNNERVSNMHSCQAALKGMPSLIIPRVQVLVYS